MLCHALLLALLGCNGGSSAGSKAPERTSTPVAFTAPALIGACASGRLSVLEVPLDLGAPYQSFEWLPLEHALARHSYATDQIVLVLAPEVDFRENVTALHALRFDVGSSRFLPEARHELGGHARLRPRYAELLSGPVAQGYAVVWTDLALRQQQGVVFSVASGTFRPAAPAELGSVPARNGLETHAAYPPDPEPTSGVSVKTDIINAKATFSRAGTELGTIRFPSLPGAYIAAFPATRTAFFWHNGKERDQARLPPAQQRHSYLVGLESGRSCRIERELAYPATAVFRRPTFVAFVNALRNEPAPYDCPPGAPCVAPEQSHFVGASLVIFDDRGAQP